MTSRSKSGGPSKGSKVRLREALLKALIGPGSEVPSVAAFCESAGISRAALYRYHREFLEEIRDLRRRARQPDASTSAKLTKSQDDNRSLQRQVNQLAALVDHYFCAWQECNELLQRRERELAELRRAHSVRPVSLKSKTV